MLGAMKGKSLELLKGQKMSFLPYKTATTRANEMKKKKGGSQKKKDGSRL